MFELVFKPIVLLLAKDLLRFFYIQFLPFYKSYLKLLISQSQTLAARKYLRDFLGIPTFSSHAEHRRHILIHTAAVFRDFARKGFTEGMSGHISVRDPEFPNYIWMNALGRHFGMMTAGDLICLDMFTGKVVGGNKVREPYVDSLMRMDS